MSDLLWSFDQLARFTRYEDPEVRYWAADRLIALFQEEACDVVSELVLDEHDVAPELAIEHLGRHGSTVHIPMLLRALKNGTGELPGRCIEALARIGYEGTPELARAALHQRDVPETGLAFMVGALAKMDGATDEPNSQAREFLLRRPELFAEPAALRAAVSLYAPADFSDLILKWLTALHFKGFSPVESCMRVLFEELQLEDCGWCIRTDRGGRIDFDRTIKAIESGYDLDLRDAIPRPVRADLAEKLQRGELAEIAASFGGYLRSRIARIRPREGDTLPERLDALGRAFTDPVVVGMAERLEPALHQWLIGMLISTVVKVSTYRNYILDAEAAGHDLDALLQLAGTETSSLLRTLPQRISKAVQQGGASATTRAVEWSLSTLEARGPFFQKSIALDVLGELKRDDLIPEIATHLSDENGYIYGAAERALASIGQPVVDHTRAILERGGSNPDVLQSLVRLSCEMCREESLQILLDHFDEVFETVGVETASEYAALLGHRDLINPLRQWLGQSPALVGHALLLIGAINNLPIPEEESILKAIDDYWKGAEGEAGPPGPGQYVM